MLHDGFQFGCQYSHRTVPDHPKLASDFIMDPKWDKFLPTFVRSSISGIVETHSGQWAGIAGFKMPSNDMEHFTHICIFLASKRSTTIDLPYSFAYYQSKLKEQAIQNQFFQSKELFLHIAKQMVEGRNWDGRIYYECSLPYIYVDRAKDSCCKRIGTGFCNFRPGPAGKKFCVREKSIGFFQCFFFLSRK